MPKKLSKEEFIEKAIKIHGNDYNYDEVEYINSHTKVKIRCNRCNKYFFVRPNGHLSGKSGCVKCNQRKAHLLAKTTKEEFIKRFIKTNSSLELIDFEKEFDNGMKSKLTVRCSKCGNTFVRKASDLLKHFKCEICHRKELSLKMTKSKEEFIEKAKTIHKDRYCYDKVKYINCNSKVEILCNTCNRSFFQTPSNHIGGKGCPHCKMSKGEIKIENILINLNIQYEKQKIFKDCIFKKYLPFDFYLPNHNLCIEFQGGQHYETFRFETDTIELEKRKYRDAIKKQYCLDHNIKLLEIRYDENVEEKLIKFLKEQSFIQNGKIVL